MRRKFHLPAPKKCKQCGKTIYNTQQQARYGMMRVISHTTTDMFDLHTYECPYNQGKFHFGHQSYYQKTLQPAA